MEDLIKALESLKIQGKIIDEYDKIYNFAINDAVKIAKKYKAKQEYQKLKREEKNLQIKIEKIKSL